MPESIQKINNEDFNKKENYSYNFLDGFESLWEADEQSLPKVLAVNPTNDLNEELDFIREEVNILRNENFALRLEMAEMARKSKSYEKLVEDYHSIIELNRNLTKQLNQVISLREKECRQIQAVRELLA